MMKRFNACDCYISRCANDGDEGVEVCFSCTLLGCEQGRCSFCFGEIEPPEEDTACCRCDGGNCRNVAAQADALKRALAEGRKVLKEMEEV